MPEKYSKKEKEQVPKPSILFCIPIVDHYKWLNVRNVENMIVEPERTNQITEP
jgi:hypothetical protein